MTDPELYFTDVRAFMLHGKPFANSTQYVPLRPSAGPGPSHLPEPVWGLSQMAAGQFIDIDTDAIQIHVEVERDLTKVSEAARGNRDQAVDVYLWDGARWGWVGIQKDLTQAISRVPIAIGMPPGRNRLRLHLGYSSKVQRLAVGAPVGCDLRDGTRPEPRPVL